MASAFDDFKLDFAMDGEISRLEYEKGLLGSKLSSLERSASSMKLSSVEMSRIDAKIKNISAYHASHDLELSLSSPAIPIVSAIDTLLGLLIKYEEFRLAETSLPLLIQIQDLVSEMKKVRDSLPHLNTELGSSSLCVSLRKCVQSCENDSKERSIAQVFTSVCIHHTQHAQIICHVQPNEYTQNTSTNLWDILVQYDDMCLQNTLSKLLKQFFDTYIESLLVTNTAVESYQLQFHEEGKSLQLTFTKSNDISNLEDGEVEICAKLHDLMAVVGFMYASLFNMSYNDITSIINGRRVDTVEMKGNTLMAARYVFRLLFSRCHASNGVIQEMVMRKVVAYTVERVKHLQDIQHIQEQVTCAFLKFDAFANQLAAQLHIQLVSKETGETEGIQEYISLESRLKQDLCKAYTKHTCSSLSTTSKSILLEGSNYHLTVPTDSEGCIFATTSSSTVGTLKGRFVLPFEGCSMSKMLNDLLLNVDSNFRKFLSPLEGSITRSNTTGSDGIKSHMCHLIDCLCSNVELFLTIIPQKFIEKLETSPFIGSVFYNDCVCICHYCQCLLLHYRSQWKSGNNNTAAYLQIMQTRFAAIMQRARYLGDACLDRHIREQLASLQQLFHRVNVSTATNYEDNLNSNTLIWSLEMRLYHKEEHRAAMKQIKNERDMQQNTDKDKSESDKNEDKGGINNHDMYDNNEEKQDVNTKVSYYNNSHKDEDTDEYREEYNDDVEDLVDRSGDIPSFTNTLTPIQGPVSKGLFSLVNTIGDAMSNFSETARDLRDMTKSALANRGKSSINRDKKLNRSLYADDYDNIDNNNARNDVNAMAALTRHIEMLSGQLQDVLPYSIYRHVIGSILELVLHNSINMVLFAEIIEESCANEIINVYKQLIQSVDQLCNDSPLAQTIPSYDKFHSLVLLLDCSLSEIAELVSQRQFKQFNTTEFIDLITATFEDTEKRRGLIQSIKDMAEM